MTYNPDKQYRSTIIRGKAKNEIDDLLPAYAKIIGDICPADDETFREKFNAELTHYLSSPTRKTLDNHRTEIAGKLFGLWRKGEDNLIHSSERTERLLKNMDHPQFFKSLITKIQFPNGMDKLNTIKDRIRMKIKIRPVAFVLQALLEARTRNIVLTKDEVAYYILNNLDVLRGDASVKEVIDTVISRRKDRVFKRVETHGKATSYSNQHITELLDLMELANLIRIVRGARRAHIQLNTGEARAIEYISREWRQEPAFDMYRYNLNKKEDVKKMYEDWTEFYTKPDVPTDLFATSTSSLAAGIPTPLGVPAAEGIDTTEIGEEGEMIVFNREKSRVRKFSERLVNRVIYFGKQRGLGYDISSIRADGGEKAEHAIYIEVKSTKRVTAPRKPLRDQFDMTRNEWVAAEQHLENYYIYRVYVTNEGIVVFIMQNPVLLKQKSKIYAEPAKYHIEFDHSSGDIQSWKKQEG